jgi:ABC-type lipoprotein release transport system permease subunit
LLVLLAWKNIWRNRKRSLIIITAITFGLWGGLLAGAVTMGWGESMVNTAIDRDLAHIQVHRPGFTGDRDVNLYIPRGIDILKDISSTPGVKAASGRTLVDGMAASPASTFGVRIEGIDPESEGRVTNFKDLLMDGQYFKTKKKNPVIIGKKLADRLNLKFNSKLVLSFQSMDNSLVYGAFRIAGIYKSESSAFDETHVFVRDKDLLRLLGSQPIIHEITIRVDSSKSLPAVSDTLKGEYPGLSVETWKELSPEVAAIAAAMESWSYVFVGIILMALIFGITNTMLMAVMERVQELGILMAVGMKKGKVFLMILLETIMLSITGGVCGMVAGAVTITALSGTGIDLSAFASSLESFGASTVLYPFLPVSMYIVLVVMIIVAASIASTMPAWKAIHLKPSEAIRTY